MRFQSTNIPVILALTISGSVLAESAFAALELRDINGKPTASSADAEFAYDTVLDVTWYLTANNTGLSWDNAKNWTVGLTVGTFSGWSLPLADPLCEFNSTCGSSQMGNLYYVALGNPLPGALSFTFPFKNLERTVYWSGTEYSLDPTNSNAWYFQTAPFGAQNAWLKSNGASALALRPGDLVPVPEPGVVALLLSGLAGMMVVRRKQSDAGSGNYQRNYQSNKGARAVFSGECP